MKRYFFVTPEGLSFKPSCDSPEPDFVEMEFATNKDPTIQDAINELIELNQNAMEHKSFRPFSIRLENDNRKNLWVREIRNKTPLAS